MNDRENIELARYTKEAEEQYDSLWTRLNDLATSFNEKMEGKSVFRIAVSILFNVIWIIAAVIAAKRFKVWVYSTYYARAGNTYFVAFKFFKGFFIGLLVSLIADNILDMLYFGKIESYLKKIKDLIKRAEVGKRSIGPNLEGFMSAERKGWDYKLKVPVFSDGVTEEQMLSIPDEATKVETVVNKLESTGKKLTNSLKNIFYFLAVCSSTIAGCLAFAGVGRNIIRTITATEFNDNTMTSFLIIAALIIAVLEFIVAKWFWNVTDCEVTNATLFAMLTGPAMFLMTIAIVTGIITLLVHIIPPLLTIALYILVGWAFLASCSASG